MLEHRPVLMGSFMSFVCTCLQDLSNYNKNAVIIAKKYFNVSDIDDYYKKADAKPLIFCHFARGLGEKVYNEVTEFRDLYKTLMEVPQHITRFFYLPCLSHACSFEATPDVFDVLLQFPKQPSCVATSGRKCMFAAVHCHTTSDQTNTT